MMEDEGYTQTEITDALSEAIWECERKPRTSLWRSFWDRLTLGGEIPDMPPLNGTDGPHA